MKPCKFKNESINDGTDKMYAYGQAMKWCCSVSL